MTAPEAAAGGGEGLHNIERKLADARRELLETSTKSRLLHTPKDSPRAKIIEIVDERADEVFRILVREGREMSFAASRSAYGEGQIDQFLQQPEDEERNERGYARRHSDTRLQASLSSEKLQTRLRAIAYDAQTFEGEQGVNILYLALGFLKWFDQREREKPRYAPLILIPVRLTRENANSRFKVSYSGEELGANLSLHERLKQDHGFDLPDLPESEDLVPSAYADEIARRIAGLDGWSVEPDSMVVGFFSFAKLMMYRDLEPNRWPLRGGLRDHQILGGLLGAGFRGDDSPLVGENAPVDPVVDIASAGHVVDADSSQMVAIHEVTQGKNLIIQGPPGTGKSQTITNLIASAVREGKSVLFVAEKMAALNVVRANLDRVELGQACLELHSHKAKKKTVLEDLRATHERDGVGNRTHADTSADLRAKRDLLNEHARRIHAPLTPSGATPFQVFGKLARLSGGGVQPPEFQLVEAKEWPASERENRRRALADLADHIATMGIPNVHPWRGAGLDVILPQDAIRLGQRAVKAHQATSRGYEALEEAAAKCGEKPKRLSETSRLFRFGEVLLQAPFLDSTSIVADQWQNQRGEIRKLLASGELFARMREKLRGVVLPEAWDEDVESIRAPIATHGASILRWLKSDYRRATRALSGLLTQALPKQVPDRLSILQSLGDGQRARARIVAGDALAAAAFGRLWRGDESDWTALKAIEQWEATASAADLPPQWRTVLPDLGDLKVFGKHVGHVNASIADAVDRIEKLLSDLATDSKLLFGHDSLADVAFDDITTRVEGWARWPERLNEWCRWRTWSRELVQSGLREIVDRVYDGRLAHSQIVVQFEYASYETLARQVFSEQPGLAQFDGRSHENVLAQFRQLDHARLMFARREVDAAHYNGIPRGGRDVGEVGTLAREWNKQRRHLPLRQLIKVAGRAMQRIKPVWMMSPLSLAQYVEPGALRFDLVLMDEASQIRPVEALGAIARGQQLVVVGDDKQLPPTSFFDRATQNDEEAEEPEDFAVANLESILGLCAAQGIPDRMLRWHYRSQHESLIAVSNLEFYKKLYVVPSAHADDLGLRLNRVRGIYDRGRSATNRLEAKAVAEAVIAHARTYGSPDRYPRGMSLGVGAFSVSQRDAILDELELLWRQNPDVAGFFDSKVSEPFFVKNLESIQGDERDVIFISVGFGRDENGHFAMNFGPLNGQGGERRLNVLISRARRRCEVFSSITAADIDLSRTQGVGVRVLKTFLQYAETGQLDRSTVGVRAIDSDFEQDVGDALSRLGFSVEHQVGVAGFFVDLAVKDAEGSGRYLLGIECDGAGYHSSRSARDRDRIREEILRSRGWRIHRIWSTDWFRRRDEELKRLIAAIDAAKVGTGSSTVDEPPPAAMVSETLVTEPETVDDDEVEVSVRAAGSPAYVEAAFRVNVPYEPHEFATANLAEVLVRIIEIEQPVHEDEIARRFAAVCGKERSGNRIQEAVSSALKWAARTGKIVGKRKFFSLKPIEEMHPRDRSGARSIMLRRPEMLPPAEIRGGLKRVIEDHVGVEPPKAIVEASRMFGFQRTGQELQRAIETELRAMIGDGQILLRNGNRLYMPDA